MPKISRQLTPPPTDLDVQMAVWCEEYITDQTKWIKAAFPNRSDADYRHYERFLRAGWLQAYHQLRQRGLLK